VKRVRVFVPAYEFEIEAGSDHEAAAIVFEKLRKANRPMYGDKLVIIIEGKALEVARASAKAKRWMAKHANPKSPAEITAWRRFQAQTT
jgi:hypothetical protein